ncbi:nitroreductase family protein [Kurthia huakuii]|uniref:nitroreductase family protein n=1 Tax=Kurthia huakuii TaxID=1421019 RepID=UPI0004967426|nr:nitroreductase family protein [Kurthia huakuii]MBM7699695.1 nitroreductase [Kurthia huakuii]
MISTQTATQQIMEDRKSVRKYKEGVTIPQEKLMELLQLATTAPSSSNMQPWRFLVIQDEEAKKELLPIAFNQEQIVKSSATIAILGDMKMYENAQAIYDANVEQGFMSREIADNMIQNSLNLYAGLTDEALKGVIQFDAGLISMQIMLLAKDMGYDTVPMGGFNKQQFAEHFKLPENEFPVVLISIGEAATPAYGSSRIPAEQLTRFI